MQPMVWPYQDVVHHRACPGRVEQAVVRPAFCHALGFALPARSLWPTGRPALWPVAMKCLDGIRGIVDKSPMAILPTLVPQGYAHPDQPGCLFERVALQGGPFFFSYIYSWFRTQVVCAC